MTPGLCENDYVAHEKHLRERLQAAEQRAEAAEARVKALRTFADIQRECASQKLAFVGLDDYEAGIEHGRMHAFAEMVGRCDRSRT